MPLAALEEESRGRGGGHAATWLPQLASAFSTEQDFEIHWLILSPRVKELKVSSHLAQTFYEIPKLPMTIEVLTGYLTSSRRLLTVINRIRPDIVHVWGAESAYPSVLKTMRQQGIPTIMSMQGILTEYDRIGCFRKNWRMKRQAQYERKWVSLPDIIVSESPWGIEKVRSIQPSIKGCVTEWGVHPSFYNVPWQPSPVEPVVLFSGGNDWRKGWDVLFEALCIKPYPKWKCWVAGSMHSVDNNSEKTLPHVDYLGNLNWRQLQNRMSRAWVLVAPSRADTGPTIVKEGRVVGLPVIVSKQCGVADRLVNGGNAIILENLSGRKLRDALDEMMSDYFKIKNLGAFQHEEDRAYFRPEKTAQDFASLYRELAEARKSRTHEQKSE